MLGCSVRFYLQLFVGGLLSLLGCSVRFYLQLFVGGFYLQLFVGGVMSCLRHLCLLVYNGVEHILCSVFCFICLRLVVCAPNIASFSVLVIRYSLTFIYSLWFDPT